MKTTDLRGQRFYEIVNTSRPGAIALDKAGKARNISDGSPR
jgi:hypothetical protein